ncbi:NADPH:quinone oxidoreductase family protein [Phaeobacter sp. PT47_59]|uniref:NADPH:quinone oxidoreductase family protein n=1 Tax=Phaeobacter sp. PT47_59 TaxID=3029979 RepID=UPI00238044EA|nr:NADPH:quinone oxidoreductase family protein [Phaeobacter sp. PT47_59]MDE4175411.1 NADPH:quinone oxidoreductase family protein [Phaeobacter sp. PT47_59]
MKAVVVREFGPIGAAKLEDFPSPEPGAREVLIEVALAPVNFVDSLVLTGSYQFLPERPFVPGKGPVGTICKVGEKVENLKVGDRVLAMAESGGYAEYALAGEENCYPLPDTLSFEDAASISLAFDTAWFSLFERGRLREGETVLVLGATGAVGDAALQLAKARGARVLAGVSSMDKAPAVIAAGADAAIDLSVTDLRANLREQVYAANAGQGVDVVIDMLGGDFFMAALRSIAWRGRAVVVGFASGEIPSVKINYLMLKNIEVSGVQISDYRKRTPDLVQQCYEEIFALCVAGLITPRPVQAFGIEDYGRALTSLIERRLSGRAVLDMRGLEK